MIVYVQTVGVLQQRVERHVAAAAQKLLSRYERSGADAVIEVIENALGDGKDSDDEIYLLVDGEGWKLAGNLDDAGQVAPWTGHAPARRHLVRAGKVATAHIVAHRLADGGLLVTGFDWHEQEAIKTLVIRASAAAGAFAVLMVAVAAFVFRQVLERSVAAIRCTAARIAAGELQERIATSDARDEFALLERDINAMLDRIQALVDGIRHVSSAIAHDLRAPLSRLIAHLRVASDEAVSPAQRLAIKAATDGAEGLSAMFSKLLQIADIEAGGHRRSFTAVALHDVVDDVVEIYEAAAHAQGSTLLRSPAGACTVWGDHDLLAGALANLLDNALKHGGAGTIVRVGTQLDGLRVRLTVEDNGVGIPPSELERIGTRFHRLASGAPGHGLGLASVRAVASAHDGRLCFFDAAPGLGAHLELPAYVA